MPQHWKVPVLAACAAALIAAAPASASFPGANGDIVFGQHWVLPPDEIGFLSPTDAWNGPNVSTSPALDAANIAWSPDGTRIAFDAPARSGGGRALHVMHVANQDVQQVGRGDRLRFNPAWSPDGRRLAFVQDNGAGAGSGDIYTMTTGGSSLTRLTTSASWDGAPDWSPDGTRIAYVCRSGGTQVCQMTPTGASKSVTTRTAGLTAIADPSWSPDSRNIAFSAAPAATPGEPQIFRMTRTGGSLRQLGTHEDGEQPAWSPDGREIALVAYIPDSSGFWGVRIIGADGTGGRWIASNDGDWSIDPGAWRPVPR